MGWRIDGIVVRKDPSQLLALETRTGLGTWNRYHTRSSMRRVFLLISLGNRNLITRSKRVRPFPLLVPLTLMPSLIHTPWQTHRTGGDLSHHNHISLSRLALSLDAAYPSKLFIDFLSHLRPQIWSAIMASWRLPSSVTYLSWNQTTSSFFWSTRQRRLSPAVTHEYWFVWARRLYMCQGSSDPESDPVEPWLK